MARRPAAEKNPPDTPLTLAKAFEACLAATRQQEDGPAELQVGERLRTIRRQKKMSVRALAAASGLAINTLSMIENGKTSPSVSTLQILARALEVSISAFFEPPAPGKNIVHVCASERPTVTMENIHLEHLGKDLAVKAVQPYVVNLEPGSDSGVSTIVHTGHEFVYCLSGRVQYIIEDAVYMLAPGDSVVFESHLPHRWFNPGDEPARFILVLCPADLRDAPAERHFPMESA